MLYINGFVELDYNYINRSNCNVSWQVLPRNNTKYYYYEQQCIWKWKISLDQSSEWRNSSVLLCLCCLVCFRMVSVNWLIVFNIGIILAQNFTYLWCIVVYTGLLFINTFSILSHITQCNTCWNCHTTPIIFNKHGASTILCHVFLYCKTYVWYSIKQTHACEQEQCQINVIGKKRSIVPKYWKHVSCHFFPFVGVVWSHFQAAFAHSQEWSEWSDEIITRLLRANNVFLNSEKL